LLAERGNSYGAKQNDMLRDDAGLDRSLDLVEWPLVGNAMERRRKVPLLRDS
jgi:hypothetical protein